MTDPVFNRPDTLLGVCEALGQDLGFNAQWLRIALAVGLLWNPVAVVAAYLGLGAVVLAARVLTPAPKVAAANAASAPVAGNDDEAVTLAVAA